MAKASDIFKEYVVTDSVAKLGCVISSTSFDIKKIAPGGWAEGQGLKVGDCLSEINGKAVADVTGDEFKTAMLGRPFIFRLVENEQKKAAVAIQRIHRGKVGRKMAEKKKKEKAASEIVTVDGQACRVTKGPDSEGDFKVTYLDGNESGWMNTRGNSIKKVPVPVPAPSNAAKAAVLGLKANDEVEDDEDEEEEEEEEEQEEEEEEEAEADEEEELSPAPKVAPVKQEAEVREAPASAPRVLVPAKQDSSGSGTSVASVTALKGADKASSRASSRLAEKSAQRRSQRKAASVRRSLSRSSQSEGTEGEDGTPDALPAASATAPAASATAPAAAVTAAPAATKSAGKKAVASPRTAATKSADKKAIASPTAKAGRLAGGVSNKKLEELQARKAAAIAQDDFDTAKQIKLEIDALQTSPKVAASASKDSRVENLGTLFGKLDLDKNSFLTSRELLPYVMEMGYPGSAAEWDEDFADICREEGFDPKRGVDSKCFIKLLDDGESDFNCDDAQLEAFLSERGASILNAPTANTVPSRPPEKSVKTSPARTSPRSAITEKKRDDSSVFARKTRDDPETTPSLDLIEQVFKCCDMDQNQRLNEREMLHFIRCLDYPGSTEVWTSEFLALCEFHDWDRFVGIDFEGFVKLLDDAGDNYFVEADQLANVLKHLELQVPLAALGSRAITSSGSRVPPGCDDAPFKEYAQRLDVPVDIKFDCLHFDRVAAIKGLSEDLQDALSAELAGIVGWEEEHAVLIQVAFSKEKDTGCLLASITCPTQNLNEARAILKDLEAADGDLQAMLTEAAHNVPRIRQAATGPVEVVKVNIGDPTPPPRKRLSMIEQGFAAASASSMKGFLQSRRGREVSPDSGMDGSFDCTQYGSDADFGSLQGSRGPSPSRKALVDGTDAAKRSRWPGGRRVEERHFLNEFKISLLKRERSLATAWRKIIDTHWQGRISLYEFSQACTEIGFGKKRQVWRELDVDHAGTVTLSELDWEGADALGSFFAILNQRYGSVKAAAQQWKLSGPRRLHCEEFLQLLVPRGIVSKEDGNLLFSMLCTCPYGNGHNLENTAPAITLREMQWLNKMGPSLPRPAVSRVSPGMLGKTNITPSTATPGATTGFLTPGLTTPGATPGFASPGFASPGFANQGFASPGTLASQTPRSWPATPGDASYAFLSDDSTRMETGDDGDSDSESNAEGSVFNKLYTEAMEHHERRRKLVTDKQYDATRENPHFRNKADPELYKRLYDDHKEKQERKKEVISDYMDMLHTEFNHGTGKKVIDPKWLDALCKPKVVKKAPMMPEGDNIRQEQRLDRLSIHGLRRNAEQREEDLAKSGKETGWKCKKKTRDEIIQFLKENPSERVDASAAAQKLHEEAKKRGQKKEELIAKAEEERRDAEILTWKCDMHDPDAPHLAKARAKCHMCKRYKAIQEAEPGKIEAAIAKCVRRDVDSHAWQRLFEHGNKHHEENSRVHAVSFNELLQQGDELGLLHNRDLKSAKIALNDAFEEDSRWYTVRGLHRDRLIGEAIETYTQARRDAEDRQEVYRKKELANPETFFRLYLDGATNAGARDEKVRMKIMEEERLMKTTSVHINTDADPGVFHRLHEGTPRQAKPHLTERRARKELPEDLAAQLATLSTPKAKAASGNEMLVFSFPDAVWPPSPHFESEFRYNMESLGAPNMHQFNARLKESHPNGILVEMRGQEKALRSFSSLSLSELVVTGCPVHEVWSQEAHDDPIGDFVDWICVTFESLEHAFNAIDFNHSGTISRANFMQACTRKGFSGNKNFVWHALDNGMGSLDMQDWLTLQPYVAHKAALSQRPHSLQAIKQVYGERAPRPFVEFAIALATQFGDLDEAYGHFDTGGYGQLGFSEFQAGARSIGWSSECRSIFQELDVNKRRQIGRNEFQLLHDSLMEEQAIHNQHHFPDRDNHDDPGYQSFDWKQKNPQPKPLSRLKGSDGKGSRGGGSGGKGSGRAGGGSDMVGLSSPSSPQFRSGGGSSLERSGVGVDRSSSRMSQVEMRAKGSAKGVSGGAMNGQEQYPARGMKGQQLGRKGEGRGAGGGRQGPALNSGGRGGWSRGVNQPGTSPSVFEEDRPMTNRAPQASQKRSASSEDFSYNTRFSSGSNTSPGSAMARSASAHHLSGGTSPSGGLGPRAQPARGSKDPPDSGDSESSYSSDSSDSPSPPFGQKKPTGSAPASRPQGPAKSIPSRQQPGQYSSGMGSSSSMSPGSPAPGGTRFDSRNSPSSQMNPREQPLPSSSRMSPSPQQSPGDSPPKRKSLLQSSRDTAAVLGTAKRISSSNQDQSWSSNQWDRKLTEIQEERSESSASSQAGPGGSQPGRAGRAGDNDGYSNPSAPSMASMPGTPKDVNVRQRLLEQQWAKKPSVARTSLVVALQGRDR